MLKLDNLQEWYVLIMNDKINFLTLKFSDKTLEKEFVLNINKENIFPIRFGIFLAIGLFFIYGLVDSYTYPNTYTSLWVIRSVIILMLSVLLITTFHSNYLERLQVYNSTAMLATGLGLLYIYTFDLETTYSYIFFASYVLFISGTFIILGLVFFNAFILITLVNILLIILIFKQFDSITVYLYLILFVSITIVQALGSYFSELTKRKFFLQEKILHEKQVIMFQQAKLASMGEMIGNISHQWRQPLNALGLNIQKTKILYDRDLLTPQKMNENIEHGLELINGMSTTINDFRDFYKPNKEKKDFVIKEAIKKAYLIIKPSLTNSNITYEQNSEDDGLTIHGYGNEFSQVIINLLNNARDVLIERKIEHPVIAVHVYKKSNIVYIDVSDNAGGIDTESLDRIFEPYFTTKEEGKGTGVGLYMSKSIIDSHMQGILSAHNNDEGACFRIELSSASS